MIYTPVLRSTILRNARVAPITLSRATHLSKPAILVPSSLLLRRTVASSVSGKPASQTLGHAALNIKEEAGNSAADLAKMISGSTQLEADISKDATFVGITSHLAKDVPKPYMVLGLAGTLPYVGASASTIYLAYQAGMAASGMGMDPGVATTLLDQALNLQVTYGAVILSFLGALHWGMEFARFGGYKGYSRLMLGVAPILFAWPTLALQPTSALIVQWVGFTGLWYLDSRATMAGWTPKWYSQYRFYLSILVGTCIIGSLAGTSYWGPVGGHGLVTHDLHHLRDLRRQHQSEKQGTIAGPIEAVDAGENSDHYVAIRKKEQKEEEGQNDKQDDKQN